ncbi:MAG TPA: hypothetical protein EYQ31_18135, partial [Candidatus Handelsmanbacteria bacterium]|nr:hypothetical protein [Candidatus Handelsmanbacteria bacterium]
YEPGSPGRIFKLDEDALIDRLVDIERAANEPRIDDNFPICLSVRVRRLSAEPVRTRQQIEIDFQFRFRYLQCEKCKIMKGKGFGAKMAGRPGRGCATWPRHRRPWSLPCR